MSDPTRADLLQQAQFEVDEIEAIIFTRNREKIAVAEKKAEDLRGLVRTISLPTEKTELLNIGADALFNAMTDVCHESFMGKHFCDLVRELLKECANE